MSEPNNIVRKRLVTKEAKKVHEDDSDADNHHSDEEDEKEWQELQRDIKQKGINKNYQTTSWPVHAPHYPEVRIYCGDCCYDGGCYLGETGDVVGVCV